MAFFMLFDVPKSENYRELKKELVKFGTIKFFKLNPDKNNKDFQFGQIDYKEVDKDQLLAFLKSKKIKSKEKESTDKKDNYQKKSEAVTKQTHAGFENKNIENPSFYFYKDKNYGKDIENFQLKHNYEELFSFKDANTFELSTIYPGLLVGSGYSHPKPKGNDDDFQLGFFFDHTTGLPLISGSSIKGLLRSVCEKKGFMDDVYVDETQIPMAIFEDGKTVFYDAFIVATKNENKAIFGSDYITSHYSDELNGEFKDPNPIKFLKILPEVTFRFQFRCEKKYMDIFRKIILDFGLGAKTNVGYGKFMDTKTNDAGQTT